MAGDSAASRRLRSTSARIRKPPRRNCCGFFIPPFFRAVAVEAAAESHRAASISSRSTSEAQLFAQASCSSKSKIVALFSTMRRKRNHTFKGTRRTVAPGKSLKSSATNPNPPPFKSKSAPRKACSILPQRTNNNRPSSTPAASAPQGSNASRPSTTAQDSPRRVNPANRETRKLIRPDPAAPVISVKQPRGNPPVSPSISAMPEAAISGIAARRTAKGAETFPRRESSSWERRAASVMRAAEAKEARNDFRFFFACADSPPPASRCQVPCQVPRKIGVYVEY